jgi:hypothetical protein
MSAAGNFPKGRGSRLVNVEVTGSLLLGPEEAKAIGILEHDRTRFSSVHVIIVKKQGVEPDGTPVFLASCPDIAGGGVPGPSAFEAAVKMATKAVPSAMATRARLGIVFPSEAHPAVGCGEGVSIFQVQVDVSGDEVL